MASVMRRPFAIANCFKQAAKPAHTTFRSFQTTQAPKQAFRYSKPVSSLLAPFASARQNVFRQAFQQGSKRGYQTAAPQNPVAQGNLTQRLIYGGGMHLIGWQDEMVSELTMDHSHIWRHTFGGQSHI